MAINLTNTNLTQISIKRLSGKAHTSTRLSIPEEALGSFIQNTTDTIFADTFPQSPTSSSAFLNIIQSASLGGPGTVMYNEFDLTVVPNTKYSNNASPSSSKTLADIAVFDKNLGDPSGIGATDTFHAYALTLKSDFQDSVTAKQSFDLASTPKSLGDVPYKNSFMSTGSSQFQIVPEFVTTVNVENPYVATVIDKLGNNLTTTDGIDYYLDTAAGILFVQDPRAAFDASSAQVPDKLRAFMFVGKYQSDLTFSADDVGLHISASEGTGFSLGNDATASFESGSAGITVTAGSTNKITIGASTDNVQFNNITGSNLLITNTASITYFETTYASSSIIYSSGSTKFGDTNDDTHIFTGSVAILYTGSGPAGPEYGFQMSGSNFLIDYGNSGSITLGTHNIGTEIGNALTPITGSGLIISQSFTNNQTHHNMVKIGETELVDISGSLVSDSFLLNVRNKSLVISASTLSKAVAQFQNSNHKLYNGTDPALSITSVATELKNDDINLLAGSTLNIKTSNTEDSAVASTNKYILISQTDPTNALGEFKSLKAEIGFPVLGGPISASAVSSSGNLFASLSLESTAEADILAVVYDTGSGQFFFTGSYGAGGDTTNLELSASNGIFLSASEGTGFSIGLMQSASFNSGSGTGLTVTAGTQNDITFELVNVLSSSIQIGTEISGAIDAATASLSSSIIGTTYEVEVTDGGTPGNVVIGLPDQVRISSSLQIGTNSSDPADAALTTSHTGIFNLINDNVATINFGGDATTINMGAAGASNVNIKGSASIDGDLIVRGTTTSINTDQLLVEDPFILLASSSSDPDTDGGIIIQTDASANGTALFYDNSSNRWALAQSSSVAYNAASATAHQFVVSVSSSAANPTGAPSNFGLSGNSLLGMMYVATTDNDGDTNTIWIYG